MTRSQLIDRAVREALDVIGYERVDIDDNGITITVDNEAVSDRVRSIWPRILSESNTPDAQA